MFQKSMAFAIATVTVCFAFAAAPVTKVEEDISQKKSTQKITWDKLADNAAPAAAEINQAVRADLVEQSCGPSEDGEQEYDYEATAQASEVNQNYVAYTVTASSYCGGAHPNYGVYHLTFNAKTGAAVDMSKEVPRQDLSGDNPDYDAHSKFQQELAAAMLAEVKASNSTAIKDTECFEDMSDADVIQQIVDFWPSISGLGPDKKVIASISPPHVATPCQFDLPMSLSSVEKFLAPNSVVKDWLK